MTDVIESVAPAAQPDIETLFTDLLKYLNSDHDVREEIKTAVRELEQTGRGLVTKLQAMHDVGAGDGAVSVAERNKSLCVVVRKTLETEVRSQYAIIAEKIPQGQYYRYSDHWRFITQRLCFIASLLIYLESQSLATREQVADLLGLASKGDSTTKTFHLELEDYLHGLLQLASELSRYALNCVTAGDFQSPLAVAKFIGDLDAGFRLLNLKNDNLRKRFDGLKYDLKKCEEVVYDITLRGLAPRPPPQQQQQQQSSPTKSDGENAD